MSRLPNLLTLFRIALIPLLVWLLVEPSRSGAALAALTFLLACLSDFFDGYLARRHGITTTLGKFLDPLADKLLVMASLVMLASIDRHPRVPGWLVVIVIGRELAVTGLRAIASGEHIVLGAEELGKYKMIFQMFALEGLLLHYDFCGVDFFAGGMYFLWVSVVISVWSGVDYHIKVARAVWRARPRVTGDTPAPPSR
ncbi:MAG TPA: CDP-diacylglycerol--glycerol-3-phosphate 3-phosphatidyltransferase [Candidatus Binatia bacterium]|nr:CDP-diacylglycerol--glycerol-3-phosphate 3-phosphatidyltransferase [Candidatus Binatia bacterium]